MARNSRRRRATRASQLPVLRQLEALLSSQKTLLAVEATVLVIVIVVGLWLRLIPWYTAANLIQNSERITIVPPDLREYGFLYGNDPWIEYWLANYLYTNGPASWTTLTTSNPDTHIFWYPWGRDFTSTSYVFVPLLTAVTYPIVAGLMSLQAWIALIPPIMSVLMIVVGYVYVRRVFGRLPALVVLPLLAFTPASLDRTHGGFVEKEGISLPFLILGLLLFSEALRRRNPRYAVLAGIALGLPGFMWGGYMLLALTIAAVAIILPFVVEDKRRLEEYYRTVLIAGAVAAAVLAVASLFNATKLVPSIAIAFGGPLAAYVLYNACSRISARLATARPQSVLANPRAIYLAILIALVAVSPALLLEIGVGGRLVYTLYWPLRGLIKFHPLIESVAEHQPIYTAFLGDPRALPSLERINIILFTGGLGALIALFYHARRQGKVEVLPLALLGGGLIYGVLGMAYLLQAASVLGSLVTAALIQPLLSIGEPQGGRRKRARTSEPGDFRRALAIMVVIALLAASLYNVALSYHDVTTRIPGILTSNSPVIYPGDPVNPSWLRLLDIIRSELPEDAVIVTWWDYGYPIAVATGRPTLADGATINSTQIEILARILVSNETVSSELLRRFGLEPGKTFIMVHDVLAYNNNTGIYLAQIDIPKSIWMIRIAGYNEADYLEVRSLPDGRQFLVFTPLRPGTYQGLLYQILADAAYNLANPEVTEADVYPTNVTAVYLSPYSIPGVDVFTKPELKHFKPYKIIAYSSLRVGNTVYYVVIALYEWTG